MNELPELLRDTRLPDNEVTLLRNGDEIFPAMLKAIREARCSICFETYVYWSGDIAEEFAEALEQKAQAGVAVHVILDWYGSLKMSRQLFEDMRASGVEVEYYRPLRWFSICRTNYRTHRKLLVVDGAIGFTGGVGVADEWTGDAQDADHWRDNHYQFEGPIVRAMQDIFFQNWEKCGHQAPPESDEAYYPEIAPAGSETASALWSSPYHGDHDILRLIRTSIEAAKSRLWIATAYFMPGERVMKELIAASERGLSIKILMCGKHIDESIVRKASRAHWGDLLAAGVELYEYERTLMHVKMLIVDDQWVTVGSANIDARSCHLNDEVVVNLFGERCSNEHARVFEDDLKHSRAITLESWEARSWWTKLKDALSALFRRQL